ncbi:DUF6221 family protein [Streptomyces venezuelae]|nr:DUF6221 family protein [Streptomyces venezuelae]
MIAFYRARLDEEAAVARKALRMKFDLPSDAPWERARLMTERGMYVSPHDRHMGAQSPARTLKRIEAERRLLDEIFAYEAKIDGEWGCGCDAERIAAGLCPDVGEDGIRALRLKVEVFDDHPDFQESWRP